MKNTLIITAFAALAAAQSITDLPTCSFSCLTTAVPQLGCGLTDFKCSCQKAGELTPILTSCVQKACSESDQKKTLEVLAAICAANGAPISTPPASSAVAPEETATPEPLPSPTAVETLPSASDESESYPTATSVAETPSGYPGMSLFHHILLLNLLIPLPAPSHLSSDVPNLPAPSSYSDFIPLPSIVGSDTIIVSRPSPQPSSVPGVLPPYPTGSPVSLPSPLPTGSGVSTPSVSSTLPEFTGAAEARKVPVVAAGLLGLAAFVL
jgi:hypothetical protein